MVRLTHKQILSGFTLAIGLLIIFGIFLPYLLSGDNDIDVAFGFIIIVVIAYGGVVFVNNTCGEK